MEMFSHGLPSRCVTDYLEFALSMCVSVQHDIKSSVFPKAGNNLLLQHV